MLKLNKFNIKGFDGEDGINVLSESRRSVQVGKRQMPVVAPEPKGRKRK